MKQGLIKDTYEIFIKEIQTIITISYISIVSIGMLFNYQKFAKFGINIFDYADIYTFLVAPFSDYRILVFTFISIVTIIGLFKFNSILKLKFPNYYSKANFGLDKKVWFDVYKFVTIFSLVPFYLYISATTYSKITSKEINQQEEISLRYVDNETINGKQIGKINDIVFLLQNEKVIAIPITSLVKEFEVK